MPRNLVFNYILYGQIYDGPHKGEYSLERRGMEPAFGNLLIDYPAIEIQASNFQELSNIFLERYGLVLKKKNNECYGYTLEEMKLGRLKRHDAVFQIMRN